MMRPSRSVIPTSAAWFTAYRRSSSCLTDAFTCRSASFDAVTSRKTTTPPSGRPSSSRIGVPVMLMNTPSGTDGFRMNTSAFDGSPRSARANGSCSEGNGVRPSS